MEPYGDEYSEEDVTIQIVTQLVELERIASSLRLIDFAIVAIGHAAHARVTDYQSRGHQCHENVRGAFARDQGQSRAVAVAGA